MEKPTSHFQASLHKGNIGYIVAFSLVLILPSIVQLTGLNTFSETNEKRVLNEMPTLELSDAFPQQFEAYYNDHFGLRNELVSLSSKMKIGMFHTSPKPELVLLGQNGFMFYNDRNDYIYDSYSKNNTVSEEALKASLDKQKHIQQLLANKGITYIVGMWPNKHTVYNAYLPLNMKMQISAHESLADQISLYYTQNDFAIVDTRQKLIDEKAHAQLYHKFDTHWNANGAFIAYREFCKQTHGQLSLTPYEFSDFETTYSIETSGDLTNMMGLDEMVGQVDSTLHFSFKNAESSFHEIDNAGFPERSVVTINDYCGNNTTVLVFRDSFTNAFLPFLSLHYHKVIYIKDTNVDVELADSLNANIVMNLRVERYIGSFL